MKTLLISNQEVIEGTFAYLYNSEEEAKTALEQAKANHEIWCQSQEMDNWSYEGRLEPASNYDLNSLEIDERINAYRL